MTKSDGFYESRAWRMMRYVAFRVYGSKCSVCNRDDTEMHVDHISPRSKHPERELDLNNLQILCKECNLGKSDWDENDLKKVVFKRDRGDMML